MHAQRIPSEAFARYGRLARLPQSPPLASDDTFRYWSEATHYHIEGETDLGYCTVFARPDAQVTWMEKHDRSPEVIIPIDGAVLLPVMGAGDADPVEIVEVRTGEAVVIDAGVWHSACLPAAGESATYFVLFRRGTPREDVVKKEIAPASVAR